MFWFLLRVLLISHQELRATPMPLACLVSTLLKALMPASSVSRSHTSVAFGPVTSYYCFLALVRGPHFLPSTRFVPFWSSYKLFTVTIIVLHSQYLVKEPILSKITTHLRSIGSIRDDQLISFGFVCLCKLKTRMMSFDSMLLPEIA